MSLCWISECHHITRWLCSKSNKENAKIFTRSNLYFQWTVQRGYIYIYMYNLFGTDTENSNIYFIIVDTGAVMFTLRIMGEKGVLFLKKREKINCIWKGFCFHKLIVNSAAERLLGIVEIVIEFSYLINSRTFHYRIFFALFIWSLCCKVIAIFRKLNFWS